MCSFEENQKKQKYADILSLGGFNAFFGDENNKDEVIKILNVSKDYDIPPVCLIGLMGTAIGHPIKSCGRIAIFPNIHSWKRIRTTCLAKQL